MCADRSLISFYHAAQNSATTAYPKNLVSNLSTTTAMTRTIQFRKALPVVHTVFALFFGGTGLFLRNALLNRPFLSNPAVYEPTLRSFIWPWPLKFAAILDMPAVLAGMLLSSALDQIDQLRPALPAWTCVLSMLIFVPLLWFAVGAWLDRTLRASQIKSPDTAWNLCLLFHRHFRNSRRNSANHHCFRHKALAMAIAAYALLKRSKPRATGHALDTK
jgi:hypothetical protein